MFVSVIIPVYRPAGSAAGHLDECLDCLARQTYPREKFEVIVIDNGGEELELARHPEVRLIREARPGSFAARNAGLRVARGGVLAFTDADCLPDPAWLERGVESVEEGKPTGISAGAIRIVPRPATVSPAAYLYSAILSFHPDGFRHSGGFGATANLFVRRSIMDAVGPFDPSYLSGGDTEWGLRAAALGFASRHVPEALVAHQARGSIGDIIRRELRLAGGNQTNRDRRGPPGRLRNLRDILRAELWSNLRWSLGEVRRFDAAAGERASVGGLVVLVQLLRTAERLRVFFGGAPRRA
jgi:glycosyltransferase involved in cell wall biosynthesis